MLNIAEIQFYGEQAGLRWDGDACFGPDIERSAMPQWMEHHLPDVQVLSLVDRRMHIAVRPNRALRPSRCRIVDDAVSINGEVDRAVPCLEYYLRLRPRHRLIGDHVTDRPATVGGRIVVMRLTPGLNEMSRAVSDPVADIEILDLSCGHRSARGKRYNGDCEHQEMTNFHIRFSLFYLMADASANGINRSLVTR